ncbi:hypothetical protein P1P75_10885 [Streptomyces sp. ID05-39B]|uniref:hypothetical protein n=1 Tax=Streptomyces sp. ID05-39B TaxID=3028664 RepID=UPI0029BDE3BF|nr:hypothetical protein [Streptomyces sp. ID05-39B]MDX3526933.1 hypothetical protein [Streptomyces sp. ID05-39B]
MSHTTFRTMLLGSVLSSWAKWQCVVHVLAVHAVGSRDPESQVERFHALWLTASLSPGEHLKSSVHPPGGPAWPVATSWTQRTSSSAPSTDPTARSIPRLPQQLCLPVYIAVDAPAPPKSRDVLFDRVLVELFDQLASSPRVSDLVHASVLAISARPFVAVELTNVGDLICMPKVACEGDADYPAAFTLLQRRIEADIAALSEQGWAVRRPIVLLLSNGAPRDDSWCEAYGRLVDPTRRTRPHIIGYGFSSAAFEFVEQVATLAAFSADLNNPEGVPGDELGDAINAMMTSMVASVRSRSLQTSLEADGYPGIPLEDID